MSNLAKSAGAIVVSGLIAMSVFVPPVHGDSTYVPPNDIGGPDRSQGSGTRLFAQLFGGRGTR